jgi:hypothetical protein
MPVQNEPNPVDDEDIYDSIELGGLRSPGVVKLSGHDRKINWDIKTAKGQKGATTELKDIPPIEFTATFYLANVDEWNAWAEFATKINSTVVGSVPKALDIEHPDLAANDISSVVLSSFGGTIHDGKGGQTVAVKFLEYKPPKPKGGAPKGSTKKTAATDPNAAALEELAALTDQYQRTPWDDGPVRRSDERFR